MTTAFRLRPQGRDRYGDRAVDEDELELPPCSIEPHGGEQGARRLDSADRASDPTRERLSLYFTDIDVDVLYTDRIRLDTLVYDVDGSPERWGSGPFIGGIGGAVVHVSRAAG